MQKRLLSTLTESEFRSKRVFVRVDLNVPFAPDGTISDDSRIQASLPTINYLREKGARVILCSHLGRPDGKIDPQLTLRPVQEHLATLIGDKVLFIETPPTDGAFSAAADGLAAGQVALLENIRFFAGEEKNDAQFSQQLAAIADVYVNDAFGTAHRAHASTEGVARVIAAANRPAVAGFLLEKELHFLQGAITNPKRPLVAIVGGSKVSTKIGVLDALLSKCDQLIIGGGMVFTFLRARGLEVGASLVEEDKIPVAKDLEARAKELGKTIVLPIDLRIADSFSNDAKSEICTIEEIPAGWRGLDIGPKTEKLIAEILASSQTILWNGPVGVFEFANFAHGTNRVAQILADRTKQGAVTIVGGGDSVFAVEKAGLADCMTHISTGGGASLELLEGKELPGVAALDDA